MNRFSVTFEIDILVDQTVLDAVLTDEWREHFYDLTTPEQVARHLASNMIQGAALSQMDGFADHPETSVRIREMCDVDCVLVK